MKIGDKYKLKRLVITNCGDDFKKGEIVILNCLHFGQNKLHEFTDEKRESFLVIAESKIETFLEKL